MLVRWDEEKQAVVPQLAESLHAQQGPHQLGAHPPPRRPRFSDDTVLDAEAVAWSIARYLEQGGHDAAVWTHNVTATEVTGELTLEFTLARPWPSFDSLLTTGLGMVVGESERLRRASSPPWEPARSSSSRVLRRSA